AAALRRTLSQPRLVFLPVAYGFSVLLFGRVCMCGAKCIVLLMVFVQESYAFDALAVEGPFQRRVAEILPFTAHSPLVHALENPLRGSRVEVRGPLPTPTAPALRRRPAALALRRRHTAPALRCRHTRLPMRRRPASHGGGTCASPYRSSNPNLIRVSSSCSGSSSCSSLRNNRPSAREQVSSAERSCAPVQNNRAASVSASPCRALFVRALLASGRGDLPISNGMACLLPGAAVSRRCTCQPSQGRQRMRSTPCEQTEGRHNVRTRSSTPCTDVFAKPVRGTAGLCSEVVVVMQPAQQL
ncbi:unnamed protein product, partial [Ectocarpus sp. 12 AP-2014]